MAEISISIIGINVNKKENYKGQTLMHVASGESNDPLEVERLLSLKVDVNARDKNNLTPLHVEAIINDVESHYRVMK